MYYVVFSINNNVVEDSTYIIETEMNSKILTSLSVASLRLI